MQTTNKIVKDKKTHLRQKLIVSLEPYIVSRDSARKKGAPTESGRPLKHLLFFQI